MNDQEKTMICLFTRFSDKVVNSEEILKESTRVKEIIEEALPHQLSKVVCGTTATVPGIVNGKMYNYKKLLSKMHKAVELNRFKSVSFDFVPEDAFSVAFDWGVTVEAGYFGKNKTRFLKVGISQDILSKINNWPELIFSLSLELLKSKYEYGFICKFPSDHFPAGYAVGIPGRGDALFLKEANRWSMGGDLKLNESIRNVYPINFITEAHLKKCDSEQTPFAEWIKKVAKRSGNPKSIIPAAGDIKAWIPNGDKWKDHLGYNDVFLEELRQELVRLKAFSWSRSTDQ